jgi:hypothetical protein
MARYSRTDVRPDHYTQPFGETLGRVTRGRHAAWRNGFVWGLTIGALSVAVLSVSAFAWYIG